MKQFEYEDLKMACEDLGFSEKQFREAIQELLAKGLFATDIISKKESYRITNKAVKLFAEARK